MRCMRNQTNSSADYADYTDKTESLNGWEADWAKFLLLFPVSEIRVICVICGYFSAMQRNVKVVQNSFSRSSSRLVQVVIAASCCRRKVDAAAVGVGISVSLRRRFR